VSPVKWRDQPPTAVCYVCESVPSDGALAPIDEPCTRELTGRHTWWVCSPSCGFRLGQRHGLGSLEYEPATHPLRNEITGKCPACGGQSHRVLFNDLTWSECTHGCGWRTCFSCGANLQLDESDGRPVACPNCDFAGASKPRGGTALEPPPVARPRGRR
jgi:DNA-directed RNA polymerase subunit RPC12/RpoP